MHWWQQSVYYIRPAVGKKRGAGSSSGSGGGGSGGGAAPAWKGKVIARYSDRYKRQQEQEQRNGEAEVATTLWGTIHVPEPTSLVAVYLPSELLPVSKTGGGGGGSGGGGVTKRTRGSKAAKAGAAGDAGGLKLPLQRRRIVLEEDEEEEEEGGSGEGREGATGEGGKRKVCCWLSLMLCVRVGLEGLAVVGWSSTLCE